MGVAFPVHLVSDLDRVIARFHGREDCARVYLQAKAISRRFNCRRFVLTEGEDRDSGVTITICGIWQIAVLGEAVRLFERDLETGLWGALSLEQAPECLQYILFWPVARKSVKWVSNVALAACWRVLSAAGYGTLPDVSSSSKKMRVLWKETDVACGFERGTMAHVLIKDWCDEDKLAAGGKALRRDIYAHLLDKPLFSVALSMRGPTNPVDLRRYLSLIPHRETLLRLGREYRNLLPLLPAIAREHWSNPDLFARRTWLAKPGQSCLSGGHEFWSGTRVLRVPDKRYVMTRKHWRALLDSPASLVKVLSDYPDSIPPMLCMLSDLPKDRSPIRIRCHLVRFFARRLNWIGRADYAGFDETVLLKVLRLWYDAAVRHHRAHGLASLDDWISGAGATDHVLDYLRAEGLRLGMPREGQRYETLMALHDDWLRRSHLVKLGKVDEPFAVRAESTVLGNYTFVPITSSFGLIEEGRSMRHCVGQYIDMALTGEHLFLHVSAPAPEKDATLWVSLGDEPEIVQLYGPCNRSVSAGLRHAAQEFCRMQSTKLI